MLYRIENTRSGVVLGDYEAEDAVSALDTFAREAGYQDYAHLQRQVPAYSGEIRLLAFDSRGKEGEMKVEVVLPKSQMPIEE